MLLTETQLLAIIEGHLTLTGEAPSTFGARIANDTGLVGKIKSGRSPTLRTVRRILEAIPGAGAPCGEVAGTAPT